MDKTWIQWVAFQKAVGQGVDVLGAGLVLVVGFGGELGCCPCRDSCGRALARPH
jgi:hypothetical protein